MKHNFEVMSVNFEAVEVIVSDNGKELNHYFSLLSYSRYKHLKMCHYTTAQTRTKALTKRPETTAPNMFIFGAIVDQSVIYTLPTSALRVVY